MQHTATNNNMKVLLPKFAFMRLLIPFFGRLIFSGNVPDRFHSPGGRQAWTLTTRD